MRARSPLSRPKVLVVVGTRPEAIKLAPVVRALRTRNWADVRLIGTGQHRDLVAPMLDFFGLRLDLDLGLGAPDQSPAEATGRTLTALDRVLANEAPDTVLAEGDTSTVLATAMACFYRRVPFVHVEAGLRSGDPAEPFPEETHRVLAGRLAALHCAPSALAVRHLRDEGVPAEQIVQTGNPVIDALLWAVESLDLRPRDTAGGDRLDRGVGARPRIFVTAHRRESFGAPLEGVCAALRALATERDVQIVFPVHPNPAVRIPVHRALAAVPNVELLEPLGYAECVRQLRSAQIVLTDSGGLQEEAPALGKPVLVLRDRTERVEIVEAGGAELVGTDPARILAATLRLLDDPSAHAAMARAPNPYGDGHAADHIADAVGEMLGVMSSSG